MTLPLVLIASKYFAQFRRDQTQTEDEAEVG